MRGEQLFAKELTVQPGQKASIRDNANSIIVVQGEGRLNKMRLSSPKLIRFHELTEGRTVRHRGRRQGGRYVRKHKRHGAAGRASVFRAGA